MKRALFVLGILLVLATVAPFVRSEEWWVRVLGFPRLQFAMLLALVLAAFLFFVSRPVSMVDKVFLLALTASLGYQAYRVVPYSPLWIPEVVRSASCEESSQIRLLIANVLMGNRQADAFLELVRAHEPDLLLTLETDQWWEDQLSVLDRDYPFAVKHARDNTYGLQLFSRMELDGAEVRFLIEDDVPSVRTGVRLRSGDWIDFYGVHPRPPKPAQDTEERDAEILMVAKEVKAGNRPAVVAGDLNDVAWSHTTRLFQRISGTLDPRVGRGRFSTFHASYPILRWPLDHVFHGESFKLSEMKLLGFFGSDHFPVLVELCHEPVAKLRQKAPEAGHEDREEAQNSIQEGKNADD
jgi:endonuclease/exonuclease/phosphatase (EEP) superfamily protein YafD